MLASLFFPFQIFHRIFSVVSNLEMWDDDDGYHRPRPIRGSRSSGFLGALLGENERTHKKHADNSSSNGSCSSNSDTEKGVPGINAMFETDIDDKINGYIAAGLGKHAQTIDDAHLSRSNMPRGPVSASYSYIFDHAQPVSMPADLPRIVSAPSALSSLLGTPPPLLKKRQSYIDLHVEEGEEDEEIGYTTSNNFLQETYLERHDTLKRGNLHEALDHFSEYDIEKEETLKAGNLFSEMKKRMDKVSIKGENEGTHLLQQNIATDSYSHLEHEQDMYNKDNSSTEDILPVTQPKQKYHHREDMSTLHSLVESQDASSFYSCILADVEHGLWRGQDGNYANKWKENGWKIFLQKCKGVASQKPPPHSSVEQSLVTFIGSFITLLLLSVFYSWVDVLSDGKYKIALPPFGALVTLQFGLTAAPPAQPRQCIYSELIAIPISILCNYIPRSILPACIEIALAPALGIGLKQYFGLTHPPAGAAAIVFSALDYGWIHFFLFELGVIIVIICSMIINNLNDHRQYPTYWYLNPRGRREDDRSQ